MLDRVNKLKNNVSSSKPKNKGSQFVQAAGGGVAGAFNLFTGKPLTSKPFEWPENRKEFNEYIEKIKEEAKRVGAINAYAYAVQLEGQNNTQSRLGQPIGIYALEEFKKQLSRHLELDKNSLAKGEPLNGVGHKKNQFLLEAKLHKLDIPEGFKKDGYISGQILHKNLAGPIAELSASICKSYFDARDDAEGGELGVVRVMSPHS